MTQSIVRVAASRIILLISSACLLLAVLLSTLSAQIHVKLPEMTVQAGSEISIPVTIGDLGREKVTAFEFVISCDTSIIRFSGVEQAGTLSDGLTMFANNRVRPFSAGRMKVVCASAEPIQGKGVLVKIIATAANKAGSSRMALTNVVLNAGRPEARSVNGHIRLKLQRTERSTRRSDSLIKFR